MKIKRDALVQHLGRIQCGGQVTEVVFTGAFATDALTPDELLFVHTPSLSKTKPLFKKGEPVGIAELPKLVKALGVISGAGNEAVSVKITVEKHRLVIDEDSRGVLRLMTAQPKTIGTHIEPDVVTQLRALAPKKENGIPLTRELVEGIRATFTLFKATELELSVGPKGGKVRVGNDTSDTAEFVSEELVADQTYTLLFGQHFVDVLGVITHYSKAMLYLGGPENFVLIDDDGYEYILSPRMKSAD